MEKERGGFAGGVMADPCISRHGGAPESNAAFERSKDYIQKDRDRILGMITFAAMGMTSHEIEDRMGKAKNCFSGRLTELAAAKKIERCGRRDGAAIWVTVQRQRKLF